GSVTRGEEIVLTPRANDPFEVVAWMPEGMFPRQDAAVQRVVIKDNDTFRVVGVSSFGCVDTAALFIAVTPDVFVPNVLSPNADGRNDYFRVKSISEPVKIISCVVFDRWGKEVWSASGPMAARGWDGTRNGAPSK